MKSSQTDRLRAFWAANGIPVDPVTGLARLAGGDGGATTADPEAGAEERTILEQLEEQRKELIDAAAVAIEQRRETRGTFEARKADDVTDEERTQFDLDEAAFGASHDQRLAEIKTLDRRIDEEELLARRQADAQAASAPEARAHVELVKEPLTYERGNGHSFFRDLAARDLPGVRSTLNDPSCQERMNKHVEEMRVEVPEIAKRQEQRALEGMDRGEHEITRSLSGPLGIRARGLEGDPFVRRAVEEQRVNPNRLDGQGGFFVSDLLAA
jgi:hypothetical protein